jgi:type II secretory pathway predicted ATPase ExeA
VKILCAAFKIEFESSAFECERSLIQEAFKLNRTGKMLVTIIDDAHLMEMETLRKLRLLLADFPKNHNLILIGQVELLSSLCRTPFPAGHLFLLSTAGRLISTKSPLSNLEQCDCRYGL